MEGEYASCKKLMQKLSNPIVNCRTCKHRHKCDKDYEDSPRFDRWDREARGNKGVYIP